jgi:quercetin dioxygenase-like cupin family protein
MRTLAGTLFLAASLFLVPSIVGLAAQQPIAAQPGVDADPGVHPVRLIDRDEIRISRVDLDPGAVRSVHTHDDIEYHVWAPESGTLEITIGQNGPQVAVRGQTFFLKRGIPHTFRNVGTTPAVVFEVFVKKSTTSALAVASDIDRLLATLKAVRETDFRD